MKHTGTFMGTKEKKTYHCIDARFDKYQFLAWDVKKPKIIEEYSFIDYVEIDTQEILNPPLKEGELVYFESENRKYTILEVARNTKGDYIYFINRTFEIIEDEETEESRIKANKKYEEEINKFEDYQREFAELKDQQHQTKTKKWWQFWK